MDLNLSQMMSLMDSNDPAKILKLQTVLQSLIDKTKSLINNHPIVK